jgi:plasmid replication initiation protein
MSIRIDHHPIRDFFISDLIDYAPKDSAEMMERPFFSISKRKRNKPIQYASPDGKLWIKVNGNPTHGMATIWDADILIWCVSRIVAQRDAGKNDIRPIIHTTPYELLRGIARGTSGQDYTELLRAIKRLRTTEVETNIRAGRRRYTAFHYLGDIEGEGEGVDDPEQLKTLTLRVPDWLLDGIMSGNILTLDREYFLLTGGIERAIYRVARKHAGAQPRGWTVKMTTLYEKTGSESPLKKFTFRIREMCRNDELPRYHMRETATQDGSPGVLFVDRAFVQAPDGRENGEGDEKGRAGAGPRSDRRRDLENARAAWLDTDRDPRLFDGCWAAWVAGGFPPDGFGAACRDPRAVMPS